MRANELRHALRLFWSSRTASLTIVVTLALAIGGTSAIFSVLDAVVLSALPFPQRDRLVALWERNPRLQLGFEDIPVSAYNFTQWRRRATTLDTLSAVVGTHLHLTGDGDPDRVGAVRVSASFFALTGVTPLLGHVFGPEDDDARASGVVVLSHRFWSRRLSSDPAVLGRVLHLDGRSYAVVGVMPPHFSFPSGSQLPIHVRLPAETDLWLPLGLTPEQIDDRGSHDLAVLARLAPGVTLAQARAEMNAIAHRLEEEHHGLTGWAAGVVPLQDQVVGHVRTVGLFLFAAVCLVLVAACANVANVVLARSVSRRRELALRHALGAGRWQILRQYITENLVVAGASGALGILVAAAAVRFLVVSAPLAVPGLRDTTVDVRVLAFTLVVSAGIGVVLGVIPASQPLDGNIGTALQDDSRGLVGGSTRRPLRALLLAAQLALAVPLLVSASMMRDTWLQLSRIETGFDAHGVTTAEVFLPDARYPDEGRQAALFARIVEGLAALPGAEAAAVVSHLPLGGREQIALFSVEGRPELDTLQKPLADNPSVSENYFEALRVPLIRGRRFSEQDGPSAPGVAIVNQSLARRFFGGDDAVGRRIRMGDADSDEPWLTIVGVVGDVRQSALTAEPRPQIYRPYRQRTWPAMTVVVRSATDPPALAAALRQRVHAVDPELPLGRIEPMESYLRNSLARPRYSTLLLTLFATLAVLLVGIGMYGTLAFSVGQRTREIGVRMALGADTGAVVRLLLGEMLPVVTAGVGAGILLSWLMGRTARALFYAAQTLRPEGPVAAVLLLALVGLAACSVPVLRATRIDPAGALRTG
jgi:predicted permease